MSKKILHIAASPKATGESYSRRVATAFLESMQESGAEVEIKTLDVHALKIPEMDQGILQVMDGKKEPNEHESAVLHTWSRLCDEFIEADGYVISFPNWNLAVPPALAKYFLAAAEVGRVFTYTEQGSVGLLKNKKAFVVMSSGGICMEENPVAKNYALDWLYGLLMLCGVTDIESVLCEGVEEIPEQANQILQEAMEKARAYGKNWM